jgi:DNA polymerase-3 subunit gamma/tau
LLSLLAPDVVSLPDEAKEEAADQGRRLGAAAVVRAMDAIGESLLAMREAPDPRVSLEVALVRVTRPELDTSLAAIVERLEKLERGAPASPAPAAIASPPSSSGRSPGDAPAERPEPEKGGPKRALGAVKKQGKPAPAAPRAEPERSESVTAPSPAAGGGDPAAAWASAQSRLTKRAVALFAGATLTAESGSAVFVFAGEGQRDLAEQRRTEVEAAMGMPVKVVVGSAPSPAAPSGAPPPQDEPPDLADLRDAPPSDVRSPIDHLTSAFPGAEVMDTDQ